jgi:hypothetical protein
MFRDVEILDILARNGYDNPPYELVEALANFVSKVEDEAYRRGYDAAIKFVAEGD